MLKSAGLTRKEAESIIGHDVGGLTDAELRIITQLIGKQGSPKLRRIFAERILRSIGKHESHPPRAGQETSQNRDLAHTEGITLLRSDKNISRAIDKGLLIPVEVGNLYFMVRV